MTLWSKDHVVLWIYEWLYLIQESCDFTPSSNSLPLKFGGQRFRKSRYKIFISPLTSRDYTIKDSYDFVGAGWLLNHYLEKFGGLGLVEVELQSFNSYSHWITNTKFSIYCMTSRDPMIKLSHDKSQLIIC